MPWPVAWTATRPPGRGGEADGLDHVLRTASLDTAAGVVVTAVFQGVVQPGIAVVAGQRERHQPGELAGTPWPVARNRSDRG
jgi:hypothetical protein